MYHDVPVDQLYLSDPGILSSCLLTTLPVNALLSVHQTGTTYTNADGLTLPYQFSPCLPMRTLVFKARLGHLPTTILDPLLGPSNLVNFLTDAIVWMPRENPVEVRRCGPEGWREGRRE